MSKIKTDQSALLLLGILAMIQGDIGSSSLRIFFTEIVLCFRRHVVGNEEVLKKGEATAVNGQVT